MGQGHLLGLRTSVVGVSVSSVPAVSRKPSSQGSWSILTDSIDSKPRSSSNCVVAVGTCFFASSTCSSSWTIVASLRRILWEAEATSRAERRTRSDFNCRFMLR